MLPAFVNRHNHCALTKARNFFITDSYSLQGALRLLVEQQQRCRACKMFCCCCCDRRTDGQLFSYHQWCGPCKRSRADSDQNATGKCGMARPRQVTLLERYWVVEWKKFSFFYCFC